MRNEIKIEFSGSTWTLHEEFSSGDCQKRYWEAKNTKWIADIYEVYDHTSEMVKFSAQILDHEGNLADMASQYDSLHQLREQASNYLDQDVWWPEEQKRTNE